jgi:hypothetical protein
VTAVVEVGDVVLDACNGVVVAKDDGGVEGQDEVFTHGCELRAADVGADGDG